MENVLAYSRNVISLWLYPIDYILLQSLSTYPWHPLHDDIIKQKLFRNTGPLCGKFTGDRWIPLTKGQ